MAEKSYNDMTTQRVNAYIAGTGITVFYIEQYSDTAHNWFTVGDTYENIEYANVSVELHNLRELLTSITAMKESK